MIGGEGEDLQKCPLHCFVFLASKSSAINFNFSWKQLERLMGETNLDLFCPHDFFVHPPFQKVTHWSSSRQNLCDIYFVTLKRCSEAVILQCEIFLSFGSGVRQIDVFRSFKKRWIVSVVRIDSPQRVTTQRKMTPWSSYRLFHVSFHRQLFFEI